MNDEELRAVVLEDIRCHRENGVSLNPYSTDMSRNSWQRGFESFPYRELIDYDRPYHRGRMAAVVLAEEKEKS